MLLLGRLHKSLLAQSGASTTGKCEPEGTMTSWWGTAVPPDAENNKKNSFFIDIGNM